MQTEFFHLTSIKLDVGSFIQPGNWGRMMKRYQRLTVSNHTVGDAWLLSRELIFEMVRREKFVGKPSRWHAAFCCFSLEEARAYQERHDPAKFNLIYKVELVDRTKNNHTGPLVALDFPPLGGIFVESTENLASFYWNGHADGPQEFVTHSRLRVLEVCG